MSRSVADRYGAVLDRLGEWQERGGTVIFRCPFGERHRNGDAHPSGRAGIGRDGKLMIRCFGCGATVNDFARHCGMTIFEFFADGDRRQHQEERRVSTSITTARYEYRDASGLLLATKHRIEPGFHGRRKDFVWLRPIPEALTQPRGLPAGWAQGLAEGKYSPAEHREGRQIFKPHQPDSKLAFVELPQITPGLYRLPELRAASLEVPVFIVEGEGKADLIASLGPNFLATCPPHGANTWDGSMAREFRGRRVVVVPDDDAPGHRHAERILGTLLAVGAREIRFLERLESHIGWPEGGDVKDWLLSMPGDVRAAALVAAAKQCQTHTITARAA